jgi:hypothetical protein
MNKIQIAVAAALLSLLASPAHAAIDTAFVAAMQTDITSVVTAIGGALLVVGGVAVAFKWGKAALFG